MSIDRKRDSARFSRRPATEGTPLGSRGSSQQESSASAEATKLPQYATFEATKSAPECTVDAPNRNLPFSEVAELLCNKESNESILYKPTISHNVAKTSWGVTILISVVFALVAYLRGRSGQNGVFWPSEWKWDHNVYINLNNSERTISLIAQVVPDTALQALADITSRPNRAYAKQWGMDFARYDAGGRPSNYDPRACFDKVYVLKTIVEYQSENSSDLSLLWSPSPKVAYDRVMLLSPDSIVTELDTNIVDGILPADKLAAMAGWSENSSLDTSSDVILFNLRHPHASAVASLWWEMVKPSHVSCGANNDLVLLVSAISMVMDESESLEDLLVPLSQTLDGFVGDNLIKYIPSSVPGNRANILLNSLKESAETLQLTADNVCYRFYPKCEVLTT